MLMKLVKFMAHHFCEQTNDEPEIGGEKSIPAGNAAVFTVEVELKTCELANRAHACELASRAHACELLQVELMHVSLQKDM